jgi:hypothetical protein
VALCQARISTKPLWGFSSSNPYHSQSRAEQMATSTFRPFFSIMLFVQRGKKNYQHQHGSPYPVVAFRFYICINIPNCNYYLQQAVTPNWMDRIAH